MLLLGRLRSRTCQGLDAPARSCRSAPAPCSGCRWPTCCACRAEAGRAGGGTAKSVLLLWLWGGPAQLDTWDPKPDAPLEYRGPFSTIATKASGVRVGELFPQDRQALADQFAILRSLHTGSNDHGVAGTIGLTGSAGGRRRPRRQAAAGGARPATGSRRGAGARLRRRSCRRSWSSAAGCTRARRPSSARAAAPLGGLYDPFRLEYDPVHGTRIPGPATARRT